MHHDAIIAIMIRTTVSFEPELHKELSVQATKIGISFSQIVNRKLANKNFGQDKSDIGKKVAADLVSFRKFGKKLGKTDWTKLIRAERDRDNG